MQCSSCAQPNRDGARFCDNCGRPLATAVQPPAAPRPERQLAVPSHLAEKIQHARAQIAGERKQVTVLFADVKESMDLAEDVDPEEWRRILNRFYEILTEGVHRFEGTVNQYTGDGIMAIFGAPIAHEDHARHACFAALHLCETLSLYARQLRRERGMSFSVRIGLNSGEVVVGGIGPDLHMEYTAVGHTVGLASRMEHLAEPGTAYVTEHTAELAEGFFDFEDLGRFEVKGVREPVRVYELRGAKTRRSRFDIERARGTSRFVGRHTETAVLNDALESAENGRGQIVAIIGEAGVGKSRLCHEFVERVRASGIKVFIAHGQPQGRAFPFTPILELLRGYFGIDDQDGPVAARQKIAGSLLLLDESFRESLALIFNFLGVPDPDLPYPQLDPEARLAQLHSLTKRLIRARSDRGPALILVEDLQWFDEGSATFIAQLMDAVPETRTLLLLNFRPEYHLAATGASFRQVSLGPLHDDAIAELVAHRLGDHPSLVEITPYVRRRSGGNPFFIEEILQSLVGAGALVGEPGTYRLVGRLSQVTVPPTVQAIIAARLDRLSEREKNILQTAAVIGPEFARNVLERAVGLPAFEVDAALRTLIESEFIVERSTSPEPEYAFKHPLTQEVAYNSQLGDRRRAIHAAVAAATVETYDDRLDERASILARHWEESGDAHEAARWHRRAAEWAAHNDTSLGLAHWRKVRELVGAYPVDEAETLALAACLGILNLGPRHGLTESQAQALFDEGRTLAEHLGDKRSLARLLLVFARVRGISGDVEQASDLSIQAARLAEEVGLRGLRLAVAVNLASWATQFGDLRRSLEIVDEALHDPPSNPKVGAEHLGYSPFIWLVMNRGRLLTYMARCPEADDAFERALRLAREHDEPEIACWAHQGYVDLAYLRDDAVIAGAHASQAVTLAERIGTLLSLWSSYHALGRALTMRGAGRDAVEALDGALTTMREHRTGLHLVPLVLASLAEAQLVAGRPDEAERAATEAADTGEGAIVVRAQTLRSAARRALGTVDARAEGEALVAGLNVLERTGYRSLEPAVRAELAALASLLGDGEEERHQHGAVERIRQEMEMTGMGATT